MDLISIKFNSERQTLEEACDIITGFQKSFNKVQEQKNLSSDEILSKNVEERYPNLIIKTNTNLDLELEIK